MAPSFSRGCRVAGCRNDDLWQERGPTPFVFTAPRAASSGNDDGFEKRGKITQETTRSRVCCNTRPYTHAHSHEHRRNNALSKQQQLAGKVPKKERGTLYQE